MTKLHPIGQDLRQMPRMRCQISVTGRAKTAVVGDIINISLEGAFVATSAPLEPGAILPLAFNLGESPEHVAATSEVVRVTRDGMAVRFAAMDGADRRRLRRFVSQLTDVTRHRDAAIELMQAGDTTVRPIDTPEKILALLQEAAGNRTLFTAIPTHRDVRDRLLLTAVSEAHLAFSAEGSAPIVQADDEVYLMGTLDFVSYSFPSRVLRVDASEVTCQLPHTMFYSERRGDRRDRSSQEIRLVVKAPWRHGEEMSWPVLDRSARGLSFRAEPGDANFFPGTPLPGAEISVDGVRTSLTEAVVRHLTTVTDESGTWVRIGVEQSFSRSSSVESRAQLASVAPRSWGGRVALALRRAQDTLSYLVRRKIAPAQDKATALHRVIRFPNVKQKEVVGLLNTTFEATEKTKCPLVVVIPGFGGRKETFSALALTLIDNFRQNYQDLAVLRIDGTNNLGESEKDSGCEKDGHHCLKFTMSGTVDDVLGTLDWARSNRFVDPTEIIFVSASFGTVAVRRVLTMPQAADVGQWFVLMGASDAQSIMLHGAGNLDIYGNYLRGISMGVINLVGCLVDADNFCRDMHQHNVASLEDARRDMAAIRADITWVVGSQDALADPRRVRDIMSVKAPGEREIIEVDAGHLPRNSDEALEEFKLVTTRIWRRLFGRSLVARTPSRGWLAHAAEREWARVYKSSAINSVAYWRTYLLGQDDLGFDILNFSPKYRALIESQVTAAEPAGKHVLDLGAGTGNISQELARQGCRRLSALDLVPEALERLRTKLPEQLTVETKAGNIDGSATIMLRRWLAGELTGPLEMAGRLPGVSHAALQHIAGTYDRHLHAVLRGAPLDLAQLPSASRLDATHRQIIDDIRRCSAALRATGRIDGAGLQRIEARAFAEVNGLPYPDNCFDAVVASLVLSYVNHPDETLFEIKRVLRPGGRLVISSMKHDADTSKTYFEVLTWLQQAPQSDLPAHQRREDLVAVARNFSNAAAELMRIEEEGGFKFYSLEELQEAVGRAGFLGASGFHSFGEPGQAVVVACEKAGAPTAG